MTPQALRRLAIVCCVAGVAGMIVTNIRGDQQGALAFGFVTAAGAGVLLLVGVLAPSRRGVDLVIAEQLELEIAELVAAGTDERRLRRIVGLARRLDPPGIAADRPGAAPDRATSLADEVGPTP
ncbi:MAG: hypothetical protein AB7W59_12275 [Acidimicrobiia bacterium]